MMPLWVWGGEPERPGRGLRVWLLPLISGAGFVGAAACTTEPPVGPTLSEEEFACLWERESLACVED